MALVLHINYIVVSEGLIKLWSLLVKVVTRDGFDNWQDCNRFHQLIQELHYIQ